MPRQSVLTGPVVLVLVIAALAWATVALGTSVARDGTTTRQSEADQYERAAAVVDRDGGATGTVQGLAAGTPVPALEPGQSPLDERSMPE